MTPLCEAQTIFGRCWDDAAHQIQGGCRHEHIRIRALCSNHAKDILGSDAAAACLVCYELDGHHCPVTARVVLP
jgi:hypothetical protein